jgi:energy-coupling factor transporter ATP-binding protein EcfA2
MWELVFRLLLIAASPFMVMAAIFAVTFGVYYACGRRLPKRTSAYKKQGFFKRVFFDFPRQYWLDKFNRDPDEFNEYGLHLFCGEQGSGKTTAVVHLLMKLKDQYRKMKIRTNFHYAHQDGAIDDWRELVRNENGVYGQAEVIDEIQTWFSSNQSRDFPPEMLMEISQQRKQRKMLIGTAQVFGRISKPIREQTTFVYCPMTLAGCLTIVRVTKPIYYDDEKCKFKRYIKHYFFVHNHKIRNAFDTYKKIEGLAKAGFHTRNDLKDSA